MRILYILCAALCFTPAAFAQIPDDAVPPLPPSVQQEAVTPAQAAYSDGADFVPPAKKLVYENNGIKYATGGVGDEEETELKAIASTFNLQILSTMENGEYISAYTITVKQGDTTVFEGKGEGPRFLLALPPGAYVVESSYKDETAKPQKTSVPAKGHRELRFRWTNK
jgi:hypothetical protein